MRRPCQCLLLTRSYRSLTGLPIHRFPEPIMFSSGVSTTPPWVTVLLRRRISTGWHLLLARPSLLCRPYVDLDAITRDAPLEVIKRKIGPCFPHSAIGGSSREHVGWAWCTHVELKYSEKHKNYMSTSLRFKLSIRCPP